MNPKDAAFPTLDDVGAGIHLREHGMTIRAYFFAATLPAVIARLGRVEMEAAPHEAAAWATRFTLIAVDTALRALNEEPT